MRKTACLLAALAVSLLTASAQCTFRNTAFKSGEFLTYNLYYNWKFVWVKAGTASMSIVQSRRNGQAAYRASLTTRGNQKADGMFVLRDTLLAYCSTDLAPLYFRKGALEGKRYTVDEVFYSYADGKTHLRQHRQHRDGTHVWKNTTSATCVYDMLNIFLRARSFDPKGWKKGHTVKFPIADGRSMEQALLKYNGTTTVKADNGVRYRCLQLSYLELEDGKQKEVVRFFVTDDSNHVPVRLDLYLRFGTAKAFLVNSKGMLSSTTAAVK